MSQKCSGPLNQQRQIKAPGVAAEPSTPHTSGPCSQGTDWIPTSQVTPGNVAGSGSGSLGTNNKSIQIPEEMSSPICFFSLQPTTATPGDAIAACCGHSVVRGHILDSWKNHDGFFCHVCISFPVFLPYSMSAQMRF